MQLASDNWEWGKDKGQDSVLHLGFCPCASFHTFYLYAKEELPFFFFSPGGLIQKVLGTYWPTLDHIPNPIRGRFSSLVAPGKVSGAWGGRKTP